MNIEEWLAEGRVIVAQRDQLDWELAEWIVAGEQRFGAAASTNVIAAKLRIAPTSVKAARKTAVLFADQRRRGLRFDHHRATMHLPAADAAAVLDRAGREGWDERQTRIAAVARKAEIDPPMPRDHDPEHDQLMAITRAWNRAGRDVRESFRDLADETGIGVIDA